MNIHRSTHKYKIHPESLFINQTNILSSETLHLIKSSNIELFIDVYEENPNDKTETIVFIHGNSYSKIIFQNQINAFSQRYRVVAIDLLGHGNSTKLNELNLSAETADILALDLYNPLAMVAVLVQFLESNQLKKTHLAGFGLGGHLAYGIAVENPELVSSISAIGSPPILFSHDGLKKGFDEWFVNNLIPEWINSPKIYNESEDALITNRIGFTPEDFNLHQLMTEADPLVRKHLFFKNKNYDDQAFLNSCLDGEHFVLNTDLPLHLVIGEKDVVVNQQYYHHFSNKLLNKKSRINIIENEPHMILSACPEKFTALYDNFLQDICQNA